MQADAASTPRRCRQSTGEQAVVASSSLSSSSAAVPDRHRPVSTRAKSRDGEAPVATKAIVGEKVGMTQIWDDQHRAIPVTVVRVAPVRVVQVKTPEREGYSALQVTWGHRRSSDPDQARAGPLRQGRGRSRPASGRAPPRRCLRLRGRSAAHRRSPAGRRAGGRHRRLEGEGIRRRHEAAQLQGPGRLPRQPQEAPLPGLDRSLRHARAGCSRAPAWPAGWAGSR